MKKILCVSILCGFFSSAVSAADVLVDISKRSQAMQVYIDGELEYHWPISTGTRGNETPKGVYRPYYFSPRHRSKQFNNTPMPYSIFFKDGYAIHGSYQTRHLGYPASHGCIRLHPRDAAELYALIKENSRSTKILIR